MKTRYLIFGMAALAICAALYFWSRPSAPAAAAPAPSATVRAVTLTRQTVPMQIEAAGNIVAGVAQTDITLAAPGIVAGFSVQPGQAVTKGQTLAEILPDPQSIATLHKAQSAVEAAAAARNHVAALLSEHLATQADLAGATQTLQSAEADVAALRAAGTGQKLRIQAPFDGTVVAIPTAAGSMLQAGTALLQLAAAGALRIRAGFTEADALHIQPGNPATVTLLNAGTTLTATVAQRSAMLDATGLIDVTLLPQGPVLLGEPVDVKINSGSVTGDVVPRDAVLSDDQGDYVFLLDGKNIAHRKNVQVLESVDESIVLAPGLDPAMRLATTGAYQLSDGMTATLQTAAP